MNSAKTLKMACIKNIFKKSSIKYILEYWGFPSGSDSTKFAGNAGDRGAIPGLGRCPWEENGNPLHILVWRIPWTEKPGELQSMGSQRIGHE